jgi:hypothetical protein
MALASDDVGSAGPIVGAPTRRRPWAWAVLGVVLLTAVAVMGTAYGRYLLRSRPGPRSMASALKRFREVPTITSPVSLGLLSAPGPGVYELEQTVLRGSPKGHEDWWFEARTGLPVRMERHIDLATASPLGSINYDESGSWQLASMTASS